MRAQKIIVPCPAMAVQRVVAVKICPLELPPLQKGTESLPGIDGSSKHSPGAAPRSVEKLEPSASTQREVGCWMRIV